jgi:apolipoprotein N-acyltransferase
MFGALFLTIGVAYVFSLLFYWIGRAFLAAPGIAAGVLITVVIALLLAAVLVKMIKKKQICPHGCGGCDGLNGCAQKDGKAKEKE